MNTGIGLYIQEDQTIVAVVVESGKKLRLTQLETIPGSVWQDREAGQKLSALSKSWRPARPRVWVTLPTWRSHLAKIRLEVIDPLQIAQIIKYESERYIPHLDIEKVVIDFHIIQRREKSSKLLVAGMPQELVAAYLTKLESCGIQPDGLDLDTMGLFYLWQAGHPEPVAGEHLLLAVYPESCCLLLLSQGQIVELRHFRFVQPSLVQSVVADLAETTELSMEALQQPGNQPIALTPQRQTQIGERLIKELRKTPTEAGLEAIHLCGQRELVASLPNRLANKLDVTALPLALPPQLEVAENVDAQHVSQSHIAVGLALKALAQVPGGFNFRQGPFARRNFWDNVRKPLVMAATLLCLITAIAGIYAHWAAQASRKEYERLLVQAEKVYTRLKPGQTLAAVAYWSRLRAVKAAVDAEWQQAHDTVPPVADNLQRWSVVFEEIGQVRQSHYFTVDHFSLEPQEATIDGRAASDFMLDLLKTRLRKIPWIDGSDQGLRIITQQLTEPKNPKLPRQYKVVMKLRD